MRRLLQGEVLYRLQQYALGLTRRRRSVELCHLKQNRNGSDRYHAETATYLRRLGASFASIVAIRCRTSAPRRHMI